MGNKGFLDTNVLIYAYLKPKRELSKEEKEIKRRSKDLVRKIEKGKKVISSIVHLSEAANILEANLPLEKSREIINSILLLDQIELIEVDRNTYLLASDLVEEHKVSLNDAVALVIMQREGVKEIYSFDTHFDKVEWVTRKES